MRAELRRWALAKITVTASVTHTIAGVTAHLDTGGEATARIPLIEGAGGGRDIIIIGNPIVVIIASILEDAMSGQSAIVSAFCFYFCVLVEVFFFFLMVRK